MSRTVLLNASLVLAALLACAVALLAASVKPAEAAFPGANGDIPFQGQEDGAQAGTVFVADPDGTVLRRLDFPAVYIRPPDWSPDGTRVVATSTGEYSGGEIYMMDDDGSSLVNVTKTPTVHEGYAAWFPSGTRVIYCAAPTDDFPATGPTEIFAVSVDASGNTTGTPKRLIAGPSTYQCGNPVVSPNNSKIAFARSNQQGQDSSSEIYVIRTGAPEGLNNPAVKLTNNSVHDSDPDWSPDGRQIVYESPGGIWRMNSDGSGKKYLGSGRDPAFSPDGRWIAFVDYPLGQDPYARTPAIWKMRKDGTRRTKLIGHDARGAAGAGWNWMYDTSWQPLP